MINAASAIVPTATGLPAKGSSHAGGDLFALSMLAVGTGEGSAPNAAANTVDAPARQAFAAPGMTLPTDAGAAVDPALAWLPAVDIAIPSPLDIPPMLAGIVSEPVAAPLSQPVLRRGTAIAAMAVATAAPALRAVPAETAPDMLTDAPRPDGAVGRGTSPSELRSDIEEAPMAPPKQALSDDVTTLALHPDPTRPVTIVPAAEALPTAAIAGDAQTLKVGLPSHYAPAVPAYDGQSSETAASGSLTAAAQDDAPVERRPTSTSAMVAPAVAPAQSAPIGPGEQPAPVVRSVRHAAVGGMHASPEQAPVDQADGAPELSTADPAPKPRDEEVADADDAPSAMVPDAVAASLHVPPQPMIAPIEQPAIANGPARRVAAEGAFAAPVATGPAPAAMSAESRPVPHAAPPAGQGAVPTPITPEVRAGAVADQSAVASTPVRMERQGGGESASQLPSATASADAPERLAPKTTFGRVTQNRDSVPVPASARYDNAMTSGLATSEPEAREANVMPAGETSGPANVARPIMPDSAAAPAGSHPQRSALAGGSAPASRSGSARAPADSPSPALTLANVNTPVVAAAAPVPVAGAPVIDRIASPIVTTPVEPRPAFIREVAGNGRQTVALGPQAAAQPQPAAGTTAPAAHVFGAAMHAAVGNDERTRAEPLDPAITATAAPAPMQAVAAMAGAGQPTLDMRQDGWPTHMINHINELRDAADAVDSRIRLVPDALGAIDIAVKTVGDTIHVRFSAEEAATRSLIENAQPRLAEIAQERGMKIGQTVVEPTPSANPTNTGQSPAGNGQQQASAHTQTQTQAQAQGGQQQPRQQPQQQTATPRQPAAPARAPSTDHDAATIGRIA